MTQTYLIEISPADITESKENKSRELFFFKLHELFLKNNKTMQVILSLKTTQFRFHRLPG